MEGNKVPRLRFALFSGEWEEKRFDSQVQLSRGLTYSPENICGNGIRVLRSSNINEDRFVINDDDVFVSRDAINIKYTENGDILITSANGSSRLVGKHAIIQNISSPTVHGGFMLLARTKFPYFINASMSSSWYRKFIDMFVLGGNGAIGNLNKTDLDSCYFSFPSLLEQQRIGEFFRSLDGVIELSERKTRGLRRLKSACLEAMFPTQGERVPRLRFTLFSGEWEEKRLGEMTSYKTSSLSTSAVSNDGIYELYDANGVIGRTNQNVQTEDYITIIKDGSGVGTVRLLPRNTSFIGTMGAIVGKGLDVFFLYSLLQKFDFSSYVNGATIPHVYYSDYSKSLVRFPSLPEQQRIGEFFRSLDGVIELSEKKTRGLRRLKSACLEAMFV